VSFDVFLDRNRLFADSPDRPTLMAMPERPTLILTCADPRVEPAVCLRVGVAEAVVLRNTGGRVTETVIADIAMLSQIGEFLRIDNAGRPLEVAILHHTHCGTAFLDDHGFRRLLATRTGADEAALAGQAVTDPYCSVESDVDLLLNTSVDVGHISVSGHVLDLETGRVTTVRPAALPVSALRADP
jgi:carbonic anhydrase